MAGILSPQVIYCRVGVAVIWPGTELAIRTTHDCDTPFCCGWRAPLAQRSTVCCASNLSRPLCSGRTQLIIVDCDLGSVKASGMEQLPSPVRRTLTKAVRAVLHSNLGNLDAPIRLSKPAGVARGKEGWGKGGISSASTGGGGAPLASFHQRGPSASTDRTFAGVGLSAWADRDRTHQISSAAGAAGQGGGEKSAEAGDSSAEGGRRSAVGVGSDGDGDGQVAVRRARRGRTRGAGARMEALLRLEFARAMADMLYGFTECLFFLHPDRPIFNGARFLQVCSWFL